MRSPLVFAFAAVVAILTFTYAPTAQAKQTCTGAFCPYLKFGCGIAGGAYGQVTSTDGSVWGICIFS